MKLDDLFLDYVEMFNIILTPANSLIKSCILLSHIYIYTQHNISMYYRSQSAIWPHPTVQVQPNSQVTDITLTGRQRLKDNHLSTSLWFFNLPLGIGDNKRGPPF